ncbi:MAG: S8 family serine peptidase, partial [Chthonomonadales bacterium]
MVESSSFFRRKNVARLATRLLLVAVAAIIFASVFSSSSQAQRRRSIERHPAQDQPGSFVPGELIVAIKLNGDAVAMSNALSLAKVEVIRPLALKPYFLVRVKTADNKPATDQVTLDTAKQLQGTGIFRWANPNYYCWTHDTTPNDPRYNEQWQWPLINLPKVWDNITSTPGVIIADIDTGIDTNHPEFAGRIIGGQNFTVSPPDSDVHDGNGHGTHTAGLAGASSNNGVGVASVTYGGGPLWIGKVFPDSGGSPTSIIADAVMYVADNVKTPGNKVVANMSLGRAVFSDTPDLNDPLEAAVFYGATIKDIAFSISAGNDYDVGNPPSSPARAAQLDARIFCVAACGKNLEHSFFSTARSFTTICAPGGDDPSFANNSLQMLSTFPLNQGSYGFEQG